jgi:hypothetical protein
MFQNSTGIKEITLGEKFEIKQDADFAHLFCDCTSLTTIYVTEKWEENSIRTDVEIFKNCWSLKGGNETTYLNRSDKMYSDYAVVDKDGQLGYLTLPSKDDGTGNNTYSSNKNSNISESETEVETEDKTEAETEDINTSETPDSSNSD